jgi:hypothetical protein
MAGSSRLSLVESDSSEFKRKKRFRRRWQIAENAEIQSKSSLFGIA